MKIFNKNAETTLVTYKTVYERLVDYGVELGKNKWYKDLTLAIMGGFFVCIGNVAFQLISSADPGNMALRFLGSLLFPVGLMMCVLLGGYLFTSSATMCVALLDKKVKLHQIARHLPLVLIGNFIGAYIFALFMRGTLLYEIVGNGQMLIYLGKTVYEKMNALPWWSYLLQGVLCNFIVAGCMMGVYSNDRMGVKLAIIQILITAFAVLGFSHVVANFYTFAIAALYSGALDPTYINWEHIIENAEKGKITWGKDKAAEYIDNVRNFNWFNFFFVSTIPTTIGNFLSGSILLPGPYMLITKAMGRNKSQEHTVQGH